MKKKLVLQVLLLIISFTAFAQQYAGIEIGSKGIKISIIEVKNIKKGEYEVKKNWSENVGIARGISINGALAKEDIDKAGEVVYSNYLKIITDYKIDDKNIFIVASSGVGMANNTEDLKAKIKELTKKELDVISVNLEGKLLLKGCVPPKNYVDSMILDIGGGNTKGGYIDVYNQNNFVFFPLSLDYGTVTLTEKINQKARRKDLAEFNELSFGFLPILRQQITAMYASKPNALEKENIYISGGAVWAFYTLYNGTAKQNFNEFKLEDVIYYDAVVKNNFKKFEDIAKTDSEVERVLKTYSQKHLISASNLLMTCLEAVPNINDKKLFFAKEGQYAWLLSYIADSSKGAKPVY